MTPEIIDNRYEVIKTFTGGMGIVNICNDTHKGNLLVAVKTIKPGHLPNPEARVKFLHEANIWINIGIHPNIGRAYNVEFIPETHEIYIVSEFVQTPSGLPDASLRSWIEDGRVNQGLIYKIGLQIIKGMIFATSKIPDLIHRDLKPENILIGPDEIAKVIDFGIATSFFRGVPKDVEISIIDKHNQTHSAVGTLPYMSPEQVSGNCLDCRSDIYAFGLILFELITGKMAIIGNSVSQIVQSHLSGDAFKRVSDDIHNVSIRTFLMKCVDLDCQKRYFNWTELEEDYLELFKAELCNIPPEFDFEHDSLGFEIYQQATSYLAIGASYIDVGNLEKAELFTQKALDIAKTQKTPRIEASALSNLGLILTHKCLYESAINCYETAFDINFNLYDIVNQAITLGNLGGIYQKIGNIEKSRDLFYQSLGLAKSEGCIGIQASQLGNLAISYAEQSEYEKAIILYNRAIEGLKSIDAEISIATNYSNLANIYLLIGNLDSAENYLYTSLEIIRKKGLQLQQSVILGNLANVKLAKGLYDEALNTLNDARIISQDIGDRSSLCKHLAGIANVLCKFGKYDEAINYFNQAGLIAEEINDKFSIVAILLGLGNLHIERNNFSEALIVFQRCISVSKIINDRYSEASASGNLGKVYAALFKFEPAIVYLEKSIEIAEEIKMIDIKARAIWTLGIIQELNNNFENANRYLQYAVQVFREKNLTEYNQAVLHLSDFRNQHGY